MGPSDRTTSAGRWAGKALALLRNRDFLFLLALVLGLAAPGAARPLLPLVVPALGAVMTLAVSGISRGLDRPRGGFTFPVAAGIVLSYGVLSGLFLIARALMPADSFLERGFLVLALAPPAVAVIPFTEFCKGDLVFSVVGTVAAYLGGLVLAPLLSLAFADPGAARPGALVLVLGELVLVPLVLGRVLARTPLAPAIAPWRGALTNWGFFLVIYASTGANRDLLVGEPSAAAISAAVGVVSTFGLAVPLRAAALRLGTGSRVAASAVLLGTLKNYGIAAGIALSFFGEKEAVPAVVCGAVMIPYAVWLGRRRAREDKP